MLSVSDFFGAHSVSMGLMASSVRRMKSTWALLKADVLDHFDKLLNLFTPLENYRTLREMQSQAKPPFVMSPGKLFLLCLLPSSAC